MVYDLTSICFEFEPKDFSIYFSTDYEISINNTKEILPLFKKLRELELNLRKRYFKKDLAIDCSFDSEFPFQYYNFFVYDDLDEPLVSICLEPINSGSWKEYNLQYFLEKELIIKEILRNLMRKF